MDCGGIFCALRSDAHAAGGAEGRDYRRSDRGNHLYDELQGFSLAHSDFNLIG